MGNDSAIHRCSKPWSGKYFPFSNCRYISYIFCSIAWKVKQYSFVPFILLLTPIQISWQAETTQFTWHSSTLVDYLSAVLYVRGFRGSGARSKVSHPSIIRSRGVLLFCSTNLQLRCSKPAIFPTHDKKKKNHCKFTSSPYSSPCDCLDCCFPR